MSHIIESAKTILIKIGSELLYDKKKDAVRYDNLLTILSDVNYFYQQGKNIIIVTSGAVALGRSTVIKNPGEAEINQLQAAAAVGQAKLIDAYQKVLSLYNLPFAQILYGVEDKDDPRRYHNAKSTLKELIKNKIIPIINENNTVSQKNIAFRDNDQLSAYIAEMTDGDVLIIFTSVKGLYTADPRNNPAAQLVRVVNEITPAIEALAESSKSDHGKGGMKSKLAAAKYASTHGCHVFITAVAADKPIQYLMVNDDYTHFIPSLPKSSERLAWLANSPVKSGHVKIKASSKIKIEMGMAIEIGDIVKVDEFFKAGDLIYISADSDAEFAKGIVNYSSEELSDIMKYHNNVQSFIGDYIKCDVIDAENIIFLKKMSNK